MNQWRVLFFSFLFLPFIAVVLCRGSSHTRATNESHEATANANGGQREEQAYLQYQQALLAQQKQQQQAPAPPTYQQMVEERNQALTRAIADAHHSAVSLEAPNPAHIRHAYSRAQDRDPRGGDLAEVWKKLDKKSTVGRCWWTIRPKF